MAVSLTGDAETVRHALQCSAEDFRAFASGTMEPPYLELEKLVTLIIREQGIIIAKNRELLAQIRGKPKS